MLLPLLLVVGVAGGTFAYFALKERTSVEEEALSNSLYEVKDEVELVAHPLLDLVVEDDAEDQTVSVFPLNLSKDEQEDSYSHDALKKPNFKEPIFEDDEAEKELIKLQQETPRPLSPTSFDMLFNALWSGRDKLVKAMEAPAKPSPVRRQFQTEEPAKPTPTRRKRHPAAEHVLFLG